MEKVSPTYHISSCEVLGKMFYEGLDPNSAKYLALFETVSEFTGLSVLKAKYTKQSLKEVPAQAFSALPWNSIITTNTCISASTL